jgi:hypothetical protein
MLTPSSTKGLYLGVCNLSRCTSGKPATWYNHGSLSHYCEDCAKMLNNDPVNKQQAMISFGHDLCTKLAEIDENGNLFEMKTVKQEAFVNNTPYVIQRMDYEEPRSRPSQYVRTEAKVYPNDPCSCGSGKKYKKCCKSIT